MATTLLHDAVRHLCHRVRPAAGGPDDAELVERFVSRRDEAAFGLLVWRHAPMVWGLCLRQAGGAHDAEDAFQATFLALVRQAASIGKRTAVGAWLYRVAYRTARKARYRAARRAAHERAAPAPAAADPLEELAWRDLGPVLDEEVKRLPERLRGPFVPGCLEGRRNEEAAR